MSRRLLAIVLLAGAVVGLGAKAAGAHALVRASSPASGAIVQRAPKEIDITFTEPPELELTIVHVLDQTGKTHETGPPQLVSGSNLEIRVPVDNLPDGVYTVTWRTVSKADGHVTAGSFSFGIGVSAVPSKPPNEVNGSTSPSPSAFDAFGRWC